RASPDSPVRAVFAWRAPKGTDGPAIARTVRRRGHTGVPSTRRTPVSTRPTRIRVGALAAVAAGLIVPGVAAVPAGATISGPVVAFVADPQAGTTSDSALYGIYLAPATDPSKAARHAVLAPRGIDVDEAKVSPDGTHIAATVDPIAGSSKDT